MLKLLSFSLLKSGNPDESQSFEYGFYEPLNDKLKKDHLTFREALDVILLKFFF